MRKTKLILSIILFIFIVSSCATTEKGALPCPEFSSYRYNKPLHQKRTRDKTTHYSVKKRASRSFLSLQSQSNDLSEPGISKNESALPAVTDLYNLTRVDYTSRLTASTYNGLIALTKDSLTKRVQVSNELPVVVTNAGSAKQTGCDTIILKSGAVLTGKVEEIGQTEIKYRKCNNLTGPLVSVLKSDVSAINYVNGTHDTFATHEYYTMPAGNPDANLPRTTEGLAVGAFLASIVGIFIASIPLGIIAVVFGGSSLSKINHNPSRLKGRGLATFAIILGLVEVILMVIILAGA